VSEWKPLYGVEPTGPGKDRCSSPAETIEADERPKHVAVSRQLPILYNRTIFQ
jgi:hypothetical protein